MFSDRSNGKLLGLSALLALGLFASACLGPTQFDPTGRAPIGNLELMVDAAGGIRVVGWALDPDTGASVDVIVGSEGIEKVVRANRHRPDIAAAFPGKGPKHGFDFTFAELSPGLHGICVWVPNVGSVSEDRLLGCDNIVVTSPDPKIALDAVVQGPVGQVTASGWAFDPNSSGSSEVVVKLDGQLVKRLTASEYRNDVGVAYSRSGSVGFDVDFPADIGSHSVCVKVFNIGLGSNVQTCKTVSVGSPPVDSRPAGSIDSVVPDGAGSITIDGSATDPDGDSGLQALIEVDGGAGGTATEDVVANQFSSTFGPLALGAHEICVTLLDVPGGSGTSGDRALPCSSAVIGSTSVATGGSPNEDPDYVRPPPGQPMFNAQRDAGISTTLQDGSVFWVFGDTLEVGSDGNLLYFTNNTAAWAAAGTPGTTRDAFPGQPVTFGSPGPQHGACAGSTPNQGLWPISAVAIDQGATDRVVVFMAKMCLGTGFNWEFMGVATYEWTYDPSAPPVEQPVVGAISAPSLFSADSPYGTGSHLDSDGYLYAYECDSPVEGGLPSEYGPCSAARVDPVSLATPAAWTYWDGEIWGSDPAAAADMGMPDGTEAANSYPVSDFSVTHDAVHGVYVMAYTPWPGFTDRIAVRVGLTPQGPWTEPVVVYLPGCGDVLDGVAYYCYAGTAQPQLSEPGLLGLGYFDQLVSVGPTRGDYLTITVPFTVVVTPVP